MSRPMSWELLQWQQARSEIPEKEYKRLFKSQILNNYSYQFVFIQSSSFFHDIEHNLIDVSTYVV